MFYVLVSVVVLLSFQKKQFYIFLNSCIMDDESEQKPLLSKPQKSDGDDGGTAASHSDRFCGDFRDPSSRCHRILTLVILCFLGFGEKRLIHFKQEVKSEA